MPLPTSRDYDAVDTGPLPHTTVNALQDGTVDHEARLGVLEGAVALPPLIIPATAAGVGTMHTSGRYVSAAGSEYIVFPVPLRAGDVVTEVKVFYAHSTGSAEVVDWGLKENEADGTAPVGVLLGDDLDGSSGAWTSASVAGAATAVAGRSYVVEFFNVSGALDIAHIEVTITRVGHGQ